MTEAEVVRAMRKQTLGKSPSRCQRRFATLREYLLETDQQGPAIPHDAEVGDWNHTIPIGTATYANCRCGSTLALTSEGMPLHQLWRLLNWARTETKQRGVSPCELLNYLRDEIRKQVFATPDPGER